MAPFEPVIWGRVRSFDQRVMENEMRDEAVYHRTFLPNGPYAKDCKQDCHQPGQPVNRLENQESLIRRPQRLENSPGQQFQTADMRSKERPYYSGQRRFEALMYKAEKLIPVQIVEKVDQRFVDYATPWEASFSILVHEGPERFLPVVDENYMVIGHMGTVEGFRMLVIGEGSNEVNRLSLDIIEQYLELDEPIIVSRKRIDGWSYLDSKAPTLWYHVVTDIDGEVISGEYAHSNPGAVAVAGPLEYITGAALLAKLTAKAIGMAVRAIGRRLLQTGVAKRVAETSSQLIRRVLAKRSERKLAQLARSQYNPVTGMTPAHHRAFVAAAHDSQTIIVVRHTNPKSIPLIERGCPGKPKDLEFINTSPQTGIVMAHTAEEMTRAQRLGYFVVQDGRTARRIVRQGSKEVTEEIQLRAPFWQLEKGQVIDPKLHKPIVGDYDLMGVIDPNAPGRVLGLVAKDGQLLTDITNPTVQRASAAVNSRLDIPRVLHGPQDHYKGFRKGASAYYPDGMVVHMETEDAVRAFYERLGRQTRIGSHPRPAPNVPVVDELARRRAGRN